MCDPCVYSSVAVVPLLPQSSPAKYGTSGKGASSVGWIIGSLTGILCS